MPAFLRILPDNETYLVCSHCQNMHHFCTCPVPLSYIEGTLTDRILKYDGLTIHRYLYVAHVNELVRKG